MIADVMRLWLGPGEYGWAVWLEDGTYLAAEDNGTLVTCVSPLPPQSFEDALAERQRDLVVAAQMPATECNPAYAAWRSRLVDRLAVSVAADARARAEAEIEAILARCDEPTLDLLYWLLHAGGRTVERVEMRLRKVGWR